MSSWIPRFPGIVLCLTIAIISYFLGNWQPMVGGPVFAIIIGMIITLFWREKGKAQEGIGYTSKKVLQLAVILLGFGLNLGEVVKVGVLSLPIIISTISTSLIVAYILFKINKMHVNTAILVGVGSSICGGSAIAATAPVINAKSDEIAQSISVIFLFNVIAALIFPTLGDMLHMTNSGFGLFAGTAINDTSSVTAASAVWDGMHPGSNALDYATIVKLTRTLAIIPITFCLAIWTAYEAKKHSQEAKNKFSFKRAFPMFIFYFILASVITTVAMHFGIDPSVFKSLQHLSKFCIIMAMAAIGLSTNLVNIVRTGGPAILVGGCCWVCIALVSLGMQHLLGIW